MVGSGIKAGRSFVDPIFKPTDISKCVLSVQLGLDGVSLAILDTTVNRFMVVQEYVFDVIQNDYQLRDEILSVFTSNDYLKRNYQKILVGYTADNNVLIPDALFDESNLIEYYNFTHGSKDDFEIVFDTLINFKSKNIYAVPVVIQQIIQEHLGDVKILSSASSLIEGLGLTLKKSEGETIVIHIQYSHFEMLYFKDSKLQFFNSFKFTTAEDFLYYALFVFEQLNLDTDKTPVKLYGEIDRQSSVYNLLFKYVRNVEFGNRSNLIGYSDALDIVPKNFYFNLFQHYLCA